MDPRVRDILRRQYPVVIGVETDADGREHFAAWLLDLPGCVAQGETREEATARLEAIKPAYLATLLVPQFDHTVEQHLVHESRPSPFRVLLMPG